MSGLATHAGSLDALSLERREERRRAILDAAGALFLEKGYAGVSLAEVVRASGGSLATLYAMFENKRGLLRAVMEREKESRLAGLSEVFESAPSPCEALTTFALRLHDFLTGARVVAMMRIVIQESLRDPDFGRDFYCEKQNERVGAMAEIFARWNREGRARVDDPEEAAALFFATVVGDAQINAMVGAGDEDACACQARLSWRIAHFCRSFGIA